MEALKLKYLDWYAPSVGLIKTEVWERGLFGRKVGNVELQTFGGSGGQKLSRFETAGKRTASIA